MDKNIFPVADGTVKLSWEHIPLSGPAQTEEKNKEIFWENQTGLLQPHFKDSSLDDGEVRNDFWSVSGTHICSHHVEPRVKLYVPREASFPSPLKHIDVTRATSTSMDVMLVKSIDDYWNVDGDRDLSDTWTGFTRFTKLGEKPTDGKKHSPGGRLTRKQTTSRPDSLWPEMWKHMSDAAQRKEKQMCVIGKPKLDNVRKLRGIYFIDPANEEFQSKARGESWKFRCQQQCLGKTYKETCRNPDAPKTKYACIVEADESTRKRLEGTLHKDHEDHIAGNEISSLSQYSKENTRSKSSSG